VTRPVEFFRHTLGPAELASVERTLGSVFLTTGPRVQEFESALAEYLGVEHVVGTSSCSASLILALRVLDIGPGDEVITTPMTFVATPNAILQVGATPVFADVDESTGLLDPARVEDAITPRTRAIVSVALYGQLADLRTLRAIADRHDLALIDDAAHAVEASRDGARSAHLADLTAFSFYATKNITSGDGGALAVHDASLAERLQQLRNHGITKDAATRYGKRYRHWDMLELGYKAAMTDIEAALLLPQLERIDAQRDRRAALADRYERELVECPDVQLVARVGRSAHHLFAALVPAPLRDGVLAGLGRRQIGCAVNYRAVHTLTYYAQRCGFTREAFPHAARFGERTLSLPLWPDLPPDDVNVVVAALREALAEARRDAPAAHESAAVEST
jgi:UDP-4-amino-4-deoxy-L-arabinose-oxoglutarate aminotransferase